MFERWRKKRRERRLLTSFAERYPLYVTSPFNFVVMKAFEKMAVHLSRLDDFMAPQYSETYRQYFAKVERFKGVPPKDLYGFLGILERACYSGSDVGEEGRGAALGHLLNIEKGLDKLRHDGTQVLSSSPSIAVQRPAMVAPPLRGLPDLASYMEAEGTRDAVVDEQSAVENILRPKEGAKLAPSAPGIMERMREEVRCANFKGMREAFGEIQDSEVKDVHFNPSMIRYIMELRYRSMELFGARWRNETALSAKLMRDAQRVALADGRGFVVPDHIKLSFLSQSDIELPLSIQRREDLLDSTPVPVLANQYS